MRKHCFIYPFVCLTALFSTTAKSQQTFADARSPVLGLFRKNINADASIYNGVVYDQYWHNVAGVPFLEDRENYLAGNILYDGVLYENIPLNYDLVKDIVLTRTYNNQQSFIITTLHIAWFSIGNDVFVKINKDSANRSAPASGFYQETYKGSVTCLVRREKKMQNAVKIGDNSIRFTPYTYYYVVKNGVYHQVNKERDIEQLFADHKQEIRKFLNSDGISFKKDPAGTIAATAKYYDQLKK